MNCPHCEHELSDEELRSLWAARSASMVMNPGRKRSRKKRCPCGVMTLNRAKARGRTAEHAPWCDFFYTA